MTVQHDTFGTVDNGQRLLIEFGEYRGYAGVRRREAGREVAYIGEGPRRLPLTGTIDGEAAEAVERIPSRVNGFTVLWVPDPV